MKTCEELIERGRKQEEKRMKQREAALKEFEARVFEYATRREWPIHSVKAYYSGHGIRAVGIVCDVGLSFTSDYVRGIEAYIPTESALPTEVSDELLAEYIQYGKLKRNSLFRWIYSKKKSVVGCSVDVQSN